MFPKPKIVIHTQPCEPLNSSLGLYDDKSQTIHLYNKDLMFELVLQHELIHHERRNRLINKLSSKMGAGRAGTLFLLFVVAIGVAASFFTRLEIVAIVSMSIGLTFYLLESHEHDKVREEAILRLKSRVEGERLL